MEYFQIIQISMKTLFYSHIYDFNKHTWHKQVWEETKLTLYMYEVQPVEADVLGVLGGSLWVLSVQHLSH